MTAMRTARQLSMEEQISSGAALSKLARRARAGRLRRVSRGLYTTDALAHAKLRSTPAMLKAAAALKADFPLVDAVIASTEQIAPLMHNMPSREIVLIAVRRTFVSDAVSALARHGIPSLVLRDREQMETLLRQPGTELFAILPGANLRATETRDGLRTARPERLLVDLLLLVDRIGFPLAVPDLRAVAETLVAEYEFSISTYLDYARRRAAEARARSFLARAIANEPRLQTFHQLLTTP